MLGTVGTHAQGQTLYKKPLYNSQSPISRRSRCWPTFRSCSSCARTCRPNNFKEFVAYAKANQGKMQFGSAGAGSATHLGCVLLNYVLDTNITHVPYRGTGPAMQDLVGRTHRLPVRGHHHRQAADRRRHRQGARDHRQAQRSPALPNLPTAAEQGTKGLEAYTWNAIFLPKGAPDAIVKKLNAAAVEAMKTPAVRDRLHGLGAQIVSDDRATPQYLGTFVKSEIEKWAAPIKASGISVE